MLPPKTDLGAGVEQTEPSSETGDNLFWIPLWMDLSLHALPALMLLAGESTRQRADAVHFGELAGASTSASGRVPVGPISLQLLAISREFGPGLSPNLGLDLALAHSPGLTLTLALARRSPSCIGPWWTQTDSRLLHPRKEVHAPALHSRRDGSRRVLWRDIRHVGRALRDVQPYFSLSVPHLFVLPRSRGHLHRRNHWGIVRFLGLEQGSLVAHSP